MKQQMIVEILQKCLNQDLVDKKIIVAEYEKMASEITDQSLIIESIYDFNDLEEIWSNYKEFLQDDCVFPIMEILGGNSVCVGYGEENIGQIYYHDFDFGLFYLDKNLDCFVSKLS